MGNKKIYELELSNEEFDNISDYLKIKNTISTKENQEKDQNLILQKRTFESKHGNSFTKGIYDPNKDTLQVVFGIDKNNPQGKLIIKEKIHK